MSSDEAQSFLVKILKQENYLVQTLVIQHDQISRLYDKSINTLRLITVYDAEQQQAVPLSAVLRVGAHGNVVDNWAQGGLAIGIDMATGKLHKYGFYKHGFGTKVTCHPDTLVEFDGYDLPFFQEALQQACDLHKHLHNIVVIGWDIAITPQGPMFIEGNDNMEVSINQETNGGLKKALLKHVNY